MDFSESPFIKYLLALSGTCGFIWFLFSKAEDTLKPKVKKDISKWLKNIDPEEPVKNWPGQFAVVFDRIFGEKHFSWKCILRSSIASFTSVIIMTFIWGTLRPNEASDVFIVVLFASMVTNLLPDYLSLLQTRLFIRWMASSNSLFIVFMLLILDLVITALIFISFFLGLTVVVVQMFTGDWDLQNVKNFGDMILKEMIPLGRGGFPNTPSFGIYFYSTFFTSIWLWLYAISGFIVKLVEKVNISLTWFKSHLDINQKPLRSMALVSIMIVTILFIVWPFLR